MKPLSFNGKALTRTVDNYWYTGGEMVWIPYDLTYPDNKNFEGKDIWYADGDVYHTYFGTTYKLNKSTMTWTQVDVGLTGNTVNGSFHGWNVWYDGDNVYANKYTDTATHLNIYIFNHTTKKFDSYVSQDYCASRPYIWKSGGNIYWSFNTGDPSDPAHNLVWNRSTHKWELKSWTFSEPLQSPYGFMGNSVWNNYNGETFCTDHDNEGNLVNLFKLNPATSTWNAIDPSGWVSAGDLYSWVDYDGRKWYSQGGDQYYLDKSSNLWVGPHSWKLLEHPYGRDVWTDGTFIYHSCPDQSSGTNITHILKR